MQKIATQIFICSSLIFGVLGILIVLLEVNENGASSRFDTVLLKSFMITIFIILPSFALSVAGKYLSSKRN